MWNLIFEPQTEQTADLIIQEMQRIVGQDPRIFLSDATAYPQINGILVELEIQTVQGTNAERLSVFFDQQSRSASYV
jgi:phage baseplate assembly protein W